MPEETSTVIGVAEAVGAALAQLGVRQVFGVIGSGNFTVTNALVAHGAAFLHARHEGGAISMADAYARVTGEVGVCSVHQGPGLTNTMTGLTEAAKSRTPLLVLAADTAAAALRSNFRIEQDMLVRAVGAVPERLHSPATAVEDATRAYRRALAERRAVVLMMPLDVQASTTTRIDVPAAPPRIRPRRPTDAAILEAADAIERGQRPLILAGRGAVIAGAREPLEHLGEVLGALLATSANGNGIFAGSPWALGISGGFASPAATGLIAEADVVVTAGASLNMWTMRHGQMLNRDATIVHIDDDGDAIGAHHRANVAVVGDAAETARALVAELKRRGHGASDWRSEATAMRLRNGTWNASPYADASTATQIDPRTLSRAIEERLPVERTLAIDSGHFMGYPAMYLRVPDAEGFVFTQAYQSIGLGLGSAIGAAVARPDRLTVAALGDGGAMMALPEFETVARAGLRMLILVYNDAAYGAEVHHFGPQGLPTDLVQFPDVDFAALGRAAGLDGATVRKPEDLDVIGPWLARSGRPGLVLDAKVVPTVVAEWLEEAFRGH